MKFNCEKIDKRADEFIEFQGWLPFAWPLSIEDMIKRDDYLKSKGLYEDLLQVNQEYMMLLRHNPKPQLLMEKLVKEFIDENPQFADLVNFV